MNRALLVCLFFVGCTSGVDEVERVADELTSWRYLSDLSFSAQSNGWGPVEKNVSNGERADGDGRPLTIDGRRFGTGLGVHAPSRISFALDARCSRFSAYVGLDDEVGNKGSVEFSVLGDGRPLVSVRTLGNDSARQVSANLDGVHELTLVVDDGGDGISYDHADWADAKILCESTSPPPPTTTSGLGWDPGITKRCQFLGSKWSDRRDCTDGNAWTYFVNSESNVDGITNSCGDSNVFGESFLPDFFASDGGNQLRPSSPIKLLWTKLWDSTYQVKMGIDFIAAGYGGNGDPFVGHPCCPAVDGFPAGSGQACARRNGQPWITYFTINNLGSPSNSPLPTLDNAKMTIDLRTAGIYFGPDIGWNHAGGNVFFTMQMRYPAPPGSAAPMCTGQKPACSTGKSAPPACEWCDPGDPRGVIPRSVQLSFEPGAAATYYYPPNSPNETDMLVVRERFDGELIIINASKPPFNQPAITPDWHTYNLDLTQALAYAQSVEAWNANGCGGPGQGCDRCGTSCLPGTCNNGGCKQRLFSEAPSAKGLKPLLSLGLEATNSTFYVEMKNWKPSRR